MLTRITDFSRGLLLACCGALLFAYTGNALSKRPSVPVVEQMRIALPLPIEVMLMGGDRYFAANVATFRATTLSYTVRDPESYEALATVQKHAAILNPGNEDNYYLAAGILAWEGQHEAAQFVLEQATAFRTWDELPAFFLAHNLQFFNQDYQGAAAVALLASKRAKGENQLALKALAARWSEKVGDVSVSLQMLRAMHRAEWHPGVKALMAARIARVEQLDVLRKAAQRWQTLHTGQTLSSLDQLIQEKLIVSIPVDPLGYGYTVNGEGMPAFMTREKPQ